MKKKQKNKREIALRLYIILCLGYNNLGLYKAYQKRHCELENPYHEITVSFDTMTELEKNNFLDEYFLNLKNYPLVKEGLKLDPGMFKELKKVLLNNPYIDLEKIADFISITKVEHVDEANGACLGQVNKQEKVLYDEQTIYLYKYQVENDFKKEITDTNVYFHELIHAIFPSIKDNDFFEEAITDLILEECYVVANIGYPTYRILLKMWCETFGIDVFLKMRATGEIDSFKQALKNLDYTEKEIDNVLNHLNNYSYVYDKLLELNVNNQISPKTRFEYLGQFHQILLQDIKNVYERQYQRSMDENPIMKVYYEQLKYYGKENQRQYKAYYFTNQKDDDYIWWFDEFDKIHKEYLKGENYNLEEEEPKKFIK